MIVLRVTTRAFVLDQDGLTCSVAIGASPVEKPYKVVQVNTHLRLNTKKKSAPLGAPLFPRTDAPQLPREQFPESQRVLWCRIESPDCLHVIEWLLAIRARQ